MKLIFETHKSLVLLFLSICLLSCNHEKGLDVKITNKSSDEIHEVKIYTSGDPTVPTIELQKTGYTVHTINMDHIPKTDGSYHIDFLRNKNLESYGFGYYTNGAHFNEKYTIDILPDTIKIKTD